MLSKIAYITCVNRSGSTLVETLLGNHSRIQSVGELRNLRAYFNENRKYFYPVYPLKCSCGKQVKDCSFWKDLTRELGEPLDRIELNFSFALGRQLNGKADKVRRKFEKMFFDDHPRWFANPIIQSLLGYFTIAENCFRFYEAVAKVQKCAVVVDSSKLPHRFSALYRYNPGKVRIIVLYRNPLAVAHSMMRRGISSEEAARQWVTMHQNLQHSLKHVSAGHAITVRYEELCEDPPKELRRICQFLNLAYEPNIPTLQNLERHSVGGSPSLFDNPGRPVKDEREYLYKLKPDERSVISSIVGKVAAQLRYRVY